MSLSPTGLRVAGQMEHTWRTSNLALPRYSHEFLQARLLSLDLKISSEILRQIRRLPATCFDLVVAC